MIIQERKNRQTSAIIQVLDNRRQQHFTWDDYPQKWWTVCVDHGFTCSHSTRGDAVAWASEPAMWCDECARLAQAD